MNNRPTHSSDTSQGDTQVMKYRKLFQWVIICLFVAGCTTSKIIGEKIREEWNEGSKAKATVLGSFFLVASPVWIPEFAVLDFFFGDEAKDNLRLGNYAYKRNDFKTAFECYWKSAQKGNREAQYMVGFLYESGLGVDQNYDQAMQWYLKAASLGQSTAMGKIGMLYNKGSGVPKDDCKAVEWFRKSTEQDNPWYQVNLGYMYMHGLCVAKDYKKAEGWYYRALENKNASDADRGYANNALIELRKLKNLDTLAEQQSQQRTLDEAEKERKRREENAEADRQRKLRAKVKHEQPQTIRDRTEVKLKPSNDKRVRESEPLEPPVPVVQPKSPGKPMSPDLKPAEPELK